MNTSVPDRLKLNRQIGFCGVAYPGREKWVLPHTEWVGRAPCHPATYKDTAAPHLHTRYGRAELFGPRSYNEAPMSYTPNVGKLPVTKKSH